MQNKQFSHFSTKDKLQFNFLVEEGGVLVQLQKNASQNLFFVQDIVMSEKIKVTLTVDIHCKLLLVLCKATELLHKIDFSLE